MLHIRVALFDTFKDDSRGREAEGYLVLRFVNSIAVHVLSIAQIL